MVRQNEWMAYYEQFADYFSASTVRDGCYPRLMEHPGRSSKAIVLVHGLSDSPYFLMALAEHFHQNLGYNVYLPLLQCHGLTEPNGMEQVALDEWKANVRYAIDVAADRAEQVSVGGLSTGGTLSFYMACKEPTVTGDVYLFSAALDLAGGTGGLLGELIERMARTFLVDVLDRFENHRPLVGNNPYRYARIDKDGVRELAHLIKETDRLLGEFDAVHPFPKRVFAAHSQCDTTASIDGIKALERRSRQSDFQGFIIEREQQVAHASLVLKEAILDPENALVLEAANPVFEAMCRAITKFQNH